MLYNQNFFIPILCIFYAMTTVSTYSTKPYKKTRRQDFDNPHNPVDGSAQYDEEHDKKSPNNSDGTVHEPKRLQHKILTSCWMNINTKNHFKVMKNLYGDYEKVLETYQEAVTLDNFDEKMLQMMLESRGVAKRALHKYGNDPAKIPAGFNLGGYSMLRLKDSILFFHRMKLRNSTIFRVNKLVHDLKNMVLSVQLSLQDLHLVGAYERMITDKDPSILFYAPTYGEIEILLSQVKYNMDGRLRLLKDTLKVEHVISSISIENILMTYPKDAGKPAIKLQPENLGEFLDRLKIDLDKWLKDYFNDYLMYFELKGESNSELQDYDKKKAMAENDFMDNAINAIKTRLHQVEASAVNIPSFTLLSLSGMKIKLTDGVIRGLDTLYRRSTTTGQVPRALPVRCVDAIVGFSNLKVTYKYETAIDNGMPPLVGLIILTADELAARMSLTLVEDTESFDLTFDFVEQMKPESLTVEGAANRVIATYKHILENHIISIMSNTLLHNLRKLSTLAKCETDLNGHPEPDLDNEILTDVETAPNEQDNNLDEDVIKEDDDDSEKPVDEPSDNNTSEIKHSSEGTNNSKHLEPEDQIIDLVGKNNGGVDSEEIDEAFGPNVTRKENIKSTWMKQ